MAPVAFDARGYTQRIPTSPVYNSRPRLKTDDVKSEISQFSKIKADLGFYFAVIPEASPPFSIRQY